MSRIYPAGSRTDSSNYNPVPLWNAGCQIGTYRWCTRTVRPDGFVTVPALSHTFLFLVALNFQTTCSDMDVNQGRFLVNGKCGYTLKPTYMRDRATEFDPITLTRGDWLKHKVLHVMVR